MPALSSSSTACDVRALIQREGFNSNQANVVLSDGSTYANPFANESASKIPAATKNRSDAELREIFNSTKQSLIEEISGGKAFEELGSQQQLMIQRLRSIDQLVIKSCPDNRLTNPGGRYQLLTNVIEICDHVKSSPEIALVAIFGHELGHSLDIVNLGCRTLKETSRGLSIPAAVASQNEVKTPQEKNNTTSTSASRNDPLEMPLDRNNWRENLLEIKGSSGRVFNECGFRTRAEREELEKLINHSRVEVVDYGIPVMSHPQRAMFACMRTNYNWPQPPQDQNDAMRGGYFRYGEKSAQAWGARAVARYVDRNPNMTAREALGIIQFSPIAASTVKIDNKEQELNNVYLSEPSLQRVLKCSPDAKQTCLSHFRPSQVTASPVTAPPVAPSTLRKGAR